MSNNNWYATEDWYAPLKREEPVKVVQPVTAEEPELPKKKPKKGFWAAAIAFLLTFAIVIGLCMPAILKTRENPPSEAPKSSTSPERPSQERPSGERDADKPEATQKPSEGQEDGEMPEDWDEFFANYYQDVDTASAEVNIARGELPDSFKLQIKPAAGKELSLQELYEKCSPSIVAISGYIDGQSGYNWGTGVILSPDGLILTNTHVIEGCDRATVTLYNDQAYEAKLVGADTISDVALLKIEAKGLPAAELGDSSTLRVGDRVAAIGNPLGESFRNTLTDGIISAIERGVQFNGRSMTLLQTNTALNEGNSGGALFNMYGQIVGVTNMKMMSSYSSIEGIGFAIPSSTVSGVVNALVRDGEVRGRPSIGITVGAIPDNAKEEYQLPDGLYITAVTKGSDAEAQGVLPGDILTAVNGTPVTTTEEVNDIKNRFKVGDKLHFDIWRDGEELEFDVLLMDTNDVYGK